MQQSIKEMLLESAKLSTTLAEKYAAPVAQAADMLSECLRSGHKILLAGNGGSASQATHIAAEFTGRYKLDRKPLAAISLATDVSAITAIGNDYGFEHIFRRQIAAIGAEGDVLIALSTSGNSQNIILAIQQAKKQKIKVISLLGKTGGKQKGLADIDIIIPSENTPRIQEAHLTILHIICEIIEEKMFP